MQWLDRQSPAAEEAERALLGGLIMEPERLAEVSGSLDPSDLFRPPHRALYELLLSMSEANERIDLVSVGARAMSIGLAERVGGIAYVAELPEHCPSAANLTTYAAEVRETAQRRRLIAIGVDLANRAYAGELVSSELVAETVRALCDLDENERFRVRSHAEVVPELLEIADDIAAGAGPRPVPTGYGNRFGLDDLLCGGFRAGQLTVIAGATGMGKSGLGISFAAEQARIGRSVLYCSLELRDHELHTRALSYLSRVPSRAIANGNLHEHDRDVLDAYQPARFRLHGYHRPRCTFAHLQAEARRLWSRGLLSAIYVDYLQIMDLQVKRNELRTTAIGQLAIDIRELADELSVPAVALAQLKADWLPKAKAEALRRAGEATAPWYHLFPSPDLSDIADSSEIAKTADVVMFPVNAPAFGLDRDEGAIFVAKSRVGPLGVAECRWDRGSGCYRPYGSAS